MRCLLFNSLPLFYVHYPNVIRFGSSFLCLLSRMLFGLSLSVLCSLSQMLFSSFPLFYVHYPECYSGSVYLFYVHYSECYSLSFHCLMGQFFNCSPKLGCEGVQRNALRVQRPKSPHSEEIAQYIEWHYIYYGVLDE